MSRDGNNLHEVIATAKRKARELDETWYVIFEDEHTGRYHAVNDFDLDTFYVGTSDQQILFCTA